jgi:hypothetical protein
MRKYIFESEYARLTVIGDKMIINELGQMLVYCKGDFVAVFPNRFHVVVYELDETEKGLRK